MLVDLTLQCFDKSPTNSKIFFVMYRIHFNAITQCLYATTILLMYCEIHYPGLLISCLFYDQIYLTFYSFNGIF